MNGGRWQPAAMRKSWPELLLRMVLYAVLTVERAGDIEEICSALPENDLKEEIYNNVIEKRKIKGDEFSGMSERINEVTVTYASRSDSLSEDIIRLVKESREDLRHRCGTVRTDGKGYGTDENSGGRHQIPAVALRSGRRRTAVAGTGRDRM